VDVIVAVRANALLAEMGRCARAPAVHIPADPDGFVAIGVTTTAWWT